MRQSNFVDSMIKSSQYHLPVRNTSDKPKEERSRGKTEVDLQFSQIDRKPRSCSNSKLKDIQKLISNTHQFKNVYINTFEVFKLNNHVPILQNRYLLKECKCLLPNIKEHWKECIPSPFLCFQKLDDILVSMFGCQVQRSLTISVTGLQIYATLWRIKPGLQFPTIFQRATFLFMYITG